MTNHYATWYSFFVWLGIAANTVLGVFGLVAPETLLEVAGLEQATPVIWAQFSALLLLLLSAFYIPAAIDPFRHHLSAIFTVVARFAGVVFFGIYADEAYLQFGLYDLTFMIPQGILLALAHRKHPLVGRRWAGPVLWVVIVILMIGVPGGWLAYSKFLREETVVYANLEENFKYGSIGNEATDGLPYWIWLVLPRVFPEYLPRPGGYATFGFHWKPEHDTPIGFSNKRIGFNRVAINCAICHTASWRTTASETPNVASGGASSTTDVLSYVRFLHNSAADPRFNADTLLAAIGFETRLSLIDKLLYRYLLIPLTKKELLKQKEEFAWTNKMPDWGPGRIDPFNPVKIGTLKIDDDNIRPDFMARPGDKGVWDGTIGNSDMQPAWNLDAREQIIRNRHPEAKKRADLKVPMHWDGLNTNIREVIVSSALGDGGSRKYIRLDRENDVSPLTDRVEAFLRKKTPPEFPFTIDRELAARGKRVFETPHSGGSCASCHDPSGEKVLTLIPLDEIGTDTHRAEMWKGTSAKYYNEFRWKYDWGYDNFRNVEAYLAEPLDGIWLRAPYLHNGSVPTLSHLLGLEERPVAFYRGYDVYDPERVGFVFDGAEARRVGTRFDTTEPGNGNKGHDFGTNLSRDDKKALIEYLKTL